MVQAETYFWFGQTGSNVGICSQDANAYIMDMLSDCPLCVCLHVDEVFCICFSECHASNPFYQFLQGDVSHNNTHLAGFVNAHIWVHLSSACPSQGLGWSVMYGCMHSGRYGQPA